MPQVFDEIEWVIGDHEILKRMSDIPVLPVFSDIVLGFFDQLSKKLMDHKDARRYPDIAAYAFWIRHASLAAAKEQYTSDAQKIGRGIVFQIAPSNIPVQFAVSMTYALAAGNASIVRISNKRFEQVDIICTAILDVLTNISQEMAPYICLVRYDHNEMITQSFTDLCDVRMIWGGDRTIAAVRKCPIKARCIDLGFADRFSIAVIDADAYLKKDPDLIAADFYNDTYFSDQNACSSPRMVIWTGEKTEEAKRRFWKTVGDLVSEKYSMEPISSSEKLLKTAVCAAKYPDIREKKSNNFLVRVQLPALYEDIMEYKGNCGFFFEYEVNSLDEIRLLLKKECQTITYIGDLEDRIREIISNYGVRGADRIVPFGHGSDISFVWDGLDLPNVLSRQVGNS